MCARQQGDLCNYRDKCDEDKGLYCDFQMGDGSMGICRGRAWIWNGSSCNIHYELIITLYSFTNHSKHILQTKSTHSYDMLQCTIWKCLPCLFSYYIVTHAPGSRIFLRNQFQINHGTPILTRPQFTWLLRTLYKELVSALVLINKAYWLPVGDKVLLKWIYSPNISHVTAFMLLWPHVDIHVGLVIKVSVKGCKTYQRWGSEVKENPTWNLIVNGLFNKVPFVWEYNNRTTVTLKCHK